MALETIGLGTTANDGTGDDLRTAGAKINAAIEAINELPEPVDGQDGADGREVELRTNETHVQWKYDDEAEWTDLIALSELTGADGESVTVLVVEEVPAEPDPNTFYVIPVPEEE